MLYNKKHNTRLFYIFLFYSTSITSIYEILHLKKTLRELFIRNNLQNYFAYTLRQINLSRFRFIIEINH